MPKWVCPKCKAVIYTAMPQAMIRCPACGYKVKEKNPIRHTREGWFWGSRGPFVTKEKAAQVARAVYASGYKGRNPEEKEIKALAPRMTAIDRKLIREAEETEIRDWLKKIQSTRDLVDRRKIIKDLIEIGKKEPDMIRVIGEVIKRGRLHEEIETMRLRKLLNPVSLYEGFHGSPPLRQRKISYEPPPKDKPLLKVGRISQINYIPEFPSKKSGQEFYHISGDTGEKTLKSNLILATDSKGKNLYLLKDKESKLPFFSKRGIIG